MTLPHAGTEIGDRPAVTVADPRSLAVGAVVFPPAS